MGEVLRAPAFSLAAAGGGAGPAGMSEPQPSEEASPCPPVVTMLAREVKLWAVEPAWVATEHRSSGCVPSPSGPACCCWCCCAGVVLECRPPGWELLPLATLLASFVAATKLPALLMWLMEPV